MYNSCPPIHGIAYVNEYIYKLVPIGPYVYTIVILFVLRIDQCLLRDPFPQLKLRNFPN